MAQPVGDFSDAAVHDETRWLALGEQWNLRPGTTYLNHGSFGLSPAVVRQARRQWIDELDSQPMEMFDYRQEDELRRVTAQVAQFVGTTDRDLVLVDNATDGMNAVAANFPLRAGDEVVLTDHEYGAVTRLWQRVCRRAGAKLVVAKIPFPPESHGQVIDCIAAAMTDRTRLVVFSHITSPTALILPAAEICQAVHERGAAVCIDGPHAVATLPLNLDRLACDFYCASCHKWLCAPLGSGFLYVHPRWQETFEPPLLSWGRLQPAVPTRWSDEYFWTGTRDRSAHLALPAAIDFLTTVGLKAFRARSHYLAKLGRELVGQVTGFGPLADEDLWWGPMVPAELPLTGDDFALRDHLHHRYGIAIPIITFAGRRYARISCHLYTQVEDLERLAQALRESL